MVVVHGSTLSQPRGSGPPLPAYFWIVAQVLTTPRPVLAPAETVSPPRNRAFTLYSTPSQWLSRSSPNADSSRK
jgi:hypothetical protein